VEDTKKENLFSLFWGAVFGIGFCILIIIFLPKCGFPIDWMIIIIFIILGFVWGMQSKYVFYVAGSVFVILLVGMLAMAFPCLFKSVLSPQILEVKIAILFSTSAILGIVESTIRDKNGKKWES